MEDRTPIAELRARADLPSLIARHTSSEPRTVRFDSTFRCVCPLHAGADNPTSFHLLHVEGSWLGKCYSCGFIGDAFSFLAQLWGCSYGEAVRRWKQDEGTQYDRARPLQRPAPAPTLPPKVQVAQRYARNLGCRTSLGMTGWEWWQSQGIGLNTISRFGLGYAPECPSAPGSDSFTIPVAYRGDLFNIRHRLARPPCKNGKETGKYRGQKRGLGSQLFNADSLDVSRADDVLIVGGEKKVMVLADRGMENLMPVVSSTGGESSWQRGLDSALVEHWYDMLLDFRRVFVLFDNESAMRPVAERTARVFGRRGRVVWVPGKVDDYVMAGDEGLVFLMQALSNAQPVMQLREQY